MRILSDIRVGGMIAGKMGVLHIHMGDLPGGMEVFDQIVKRGIPIKHLRPTHCGRIEHLFKDSLAFAKRGGVIDITSGGGCYAPLVDLVKTAMSESDANNITLSTDGGGSMPRFDANGNMVGLGTGSTTGNLDALRDLVKANLPLETVLPLITTNPARHLELKGKGRLEAGMDADLCLFTEDLTLHHVMAKGKFLMKDREVLVKGTFEE